MSLEWMLIRGSGVAAFSLLSVSVIWGLLLTTKLLGSWAKAKPLTWFHESLAVASLLATGLHVVAVVTDDFIDFTWSDALVPGQSSWRPLAMAFGSVGLYGLFVLSISFYLKRFIGVKAWRLLHFTSFGVFLTAALHGMLAGTDAGESWMKLLYAVSIATVLTLILIRLLLAHVAASRSNGHQRQSDRDQGPAQPATGTEAHVPARPERSLSSDVEAKPR
jgi:predicted ferric reductase